MLVYIKNVKYMYVCNINTYIVYLHTNLPYILIYNTLCTHIFSTHSPKPVFTVRSPIF